MLVIPQKQRGFPILLCRKGFFLEKEFSYPDEFGSRTIGFDPRDLATLANEALIISIAKRNRL
jgi:hypothetical protein